MRGFAILLVLLSACSKSSAPPPPPAPTVTVAELKAADVVDATEYLATLRSRTAAVLQPQVEGQVTKILVTPGTTVAPGQPLIQIDPGRQPAAVAQARASRASREAALQLAEQNLTRTQQLVDTGALPRQELDNARTAVESARADVAALGAQIAGTQVALRYYTVSAPASGVVGDIPVRVGDTVTPQTQLTTVTDNAVLEANVSVPVDRARAITPQTKIDLLDDQSHVIGTGTAKFVSAQVNPETQSVLVKADIDNAKGALRADQIVRARVVWTTHPGLAGPALAVTRLGGQAFVYVVGEANGKPIAKQRPVQLGDLVDNAYVVASGLKPGEKLITSNIQKLRDGAPIQIKS